MPKLLIIRIWIVTKILISSLNTVNKPIVLFYYINIYYPRWHTNRTHVRHRGSKSRFALKLQRAYKAIQRSQEARSKLVYVTLKRNNVRNLNR